MKAVGFVVAAIAIVAFALGFGVLAERAFADLSGEAAVTAIAFIGTTWFAIWSFNKTKRKEAQALLFSQKAEVYQELMDILRDVHFAQKGWIDPLDENRLAERLARVRFQLIVWGGQDTIRAIDRFERASIDGIEGMFAAVARLYECVRRELGHEDDPLLKEDLLLAQITIDDRDEARQTLRRGLTRV